MAFREHVVTAAPGLPLPSSSALRSELPEKAGSFVELSPSKAGQLSFEKETEAAMAA